jgi:hypothetical protein
VECQTADNGSWRSDRLVNQNQVCHGRREDTLSLVRNGGVLDGHWLWTVIIVCNCKEVPINPIIQSTTHYYQSRELHIRDNSDVFSFHNTPGRALVIASPSIRWRTVLGLALRWKFILKAYKIVCNTGPSVFKNKETMLKVDAFMCSVNFAWIKKNTLRIHFDLHCIYSISDNASWSDGDVDG